MTSPLAMGAAVREVLRSHTMNARARARLARAKSREFYATAATRLAEARVARERGQHRTAESLLEGARIWRDLARIARVEARAAEHGIAP